MKPVNHLTMLSLLFAFMVALHLVELYFAIPIGGYPLKIGLSNLVVVFVLFYFSESSALGIVLLKILTLTFFDPRYTAFSTIISASGSLLSLGGMMLSRRLARKNITLSSFYGGVLHNLGQWTAVLLITRISQLWYYLPFLLLGGALSGLLVGSLSCKMIQRLEILKKKHRY